MKYLKNLVYSLLFNKRSMKTINETSAILSCAFFVFVELIVFSLYFYLSGQKNIISFSKTIVINFIFLILRICFLYFLLHKHISFKSIMVCNCISTIFVIQPIIVNSIFFKLLYILFIIYSIEYVIVFIDTVSEELDIKKITLCEIISTVCAKLFSFILLIGFNSIQFLP